MRRFLVILIAVCVFTIGTVAVDFGYIYDGADIFEDTEEERIERTAEEVYYDSGLLCVVVTDYGIGDMLGMLPAYAGSAVDMVMLTVDMSARKFDIYQYNAIEGESAFRISYSESENILDIIFDDMANGSYADAAVMFVNMSESAFSNDSDYVVGDYDGYEYKEYIDYTYVPQKNFSISIVVLPLIFGIAAGGISVLCVYLSYKKKVHGAIYPLSQYSNLNLTDSKDNFITKNVVVTHIPDPPQNHGGGHHRGGGFHGGSRGGGAHMGGRKF